jgi:GNAT superfamily N-acetyltransferase
MTADSEPGSASVVPMAANHLGDVAALYKELGCDAQTEDVGARFGELKNDPDSGLIDAAAGRYRGHSSRLLARAKAWAPESGLSRMVVYSAGEWVDAHAFYSGAGYRAMPEVHKHAKYLGGPGNKAAG